MSADCTVVSEETEIGREEVDEKEVDKKALVEVGVCNTSYKIYEHYIC